MFGEMLPSVTGGALVLGALSLFGLLIRQIGPWRQQLSAAEERLRSTAMAAHARCEAELRLVRHRERGSRQIIYSLLHLFEMPQGDRREGALESIRATLAELERVEALEAKHVLEESIAGHQSTEGAALK